MIFCKGFMPSQETGKLAATWHENSIWPTLGKGFWVGFIIITTGVLAIISRQDASFISIFTFLLFSWATMFLSLYLMLSAIQSVQVYPYNLVYRRVSKFNFDSFNYYNLNLVIIINKELCSKYRISNEHFAYMHGHIFIHFEFDWSLDELCKSRILYERKTNGKRYILLYIYNNSNNS